MAVSIFNCKKKSDIECCFLVFFLIMLGAFAVLKNSSAAPPPIAWSKLNSFAANKVAVDSNGNVYNAGHYNNGTDDDIKVVSYDGAGNLRWQQTYDSGDGDYVIGMTVAGDYVYTIGRKGNAALTTGDYLILKFNKNTGAPVDNFIYSNGANIDFGHNIAVDAAGNIYAIGRTVTPSHKIMMVKFDSSGNFLYKIERDIDDPSLAVIFGLARDAATGDIYVSGSTINGGNGYDFLIIKYQDDGSQFTGQWERLYNALGAALDNDDRAFGGIVISDDYVYVTGHTDNAIGTFFGKHLTVQYDKDGNFQREVSPSYAILSGASWQSDIDIDSSGNVYITGGYFDPVGFVYKYRTIMYDSDLNEQWKIITDSTAEGASTVSSGIAVDSGGNVFVAGDDLLIKYGSGGFVFIPVTANVMGFAWSENIGWISFNNRNCDMDNNGLSDAASPPCPTVGSYMQGYGVNVDIDPISPTYSQLSGYAWSSNIGWIKFDPLPDFATGLYPNCPAATCPGGSPNYPAEYDPITKKISGWARVCAGTINGDCNSATRTDGWDGWILMGPIDKGTGDNGAWIDNFLIPNEFKGWAWGSDVTGWISFNHLNCDSAPAPDGDGIADVAGCAGGSIPDYKVYLSTLLNTPPDVPGLSVFTDYCENDLNSIKFMWSFSDPEDNLIPIPQSAYKIDLTRDDLVPCSISENNSDLFINAAEINQTIPVLNCPGFIDYKHSYTWSVTVWDSGGLSSTESYALPAFETPDHKYPIADFSFTPAPPILRSQVVTFYPLIFPFDSICYDNSNNPADCLSFEWDFDKNINPGIDATTDPSDPNVTYTYTEAKLFTVDLKVTDATLEGYNCWASDSGSGNAEDIDIELGRPKWNEAEPES